LFDKTKIRESIRKAAKGRDIPLSKISEIADKIEIEILDKAKDDVTTRYIARLVMRELNTLDDVTFVRYASHQYFIDDTKECELVKRKIEQKRKEDMLEILD